MHAARDLVARVALDRVDLPVRVNAFHQSNVLMEDNEVARLGRPAGPGLIGAAGVLRPGVQSVDRAEALALVAQRRAGLACNPGGEVGAPRTRPRSACGGAA